MLQLGQLLTFMLKSKYHYLIRLKWDEIIVAFLALLELIRLRAIKVFQVHPHGEIRIIALDRDVRIDTILY